MTAKKVVVLDYGSGNLRSAERALARAGADVTVTADQDAALAADGLVVPGVGAFAACMRGIHQVRGGTVVWNRLRKQRPVLGICVGMQVLFEKGVEHGEQSEGLGVLPGTVTRLQADVVPHMGWNTVDVAPGSALFASLEDERFYFVHSYAAHPAEIDLPGVRTTTSEHGERFVAAVEHGVLSATQFHPEKSGDAGTALLGNWLRTL
jgi:glutamine amidotransferase